MNAIIKQPPCACCQEKSREIAELQSAFAREVSGLMDTIAQQKHTIATQDTMLQFADLRINRLVANAQPFVERRHPLRVQRELEKRAAGGKR